jgi:hypothetical protein
MIRRISTCRRRCSRRISQRTKRPQWNRGGCIPHQLRASIFWSLWCEKVFGKRYDPLKSQKPGDSATGWRVHVLFPIDICSARTSERYPLPDPAFAQPYSDQSKMCPSSVPSAITNAARSVAESVNATSNGTPCRIRYRQSIRTGCRASFPRQPACWKLSSHLS